MTVRSRSAVLLAGLSIGALSLTACGHDGRGAAPGPNDKIKVVASTNVWGSVAQAIGGDSVQVTSIIDDPRADPHSYESSPREAAEVSDADLVVFNGGGYDEFMNQILQGAGDKATVQAIDAEHEGPTEADPGQGRGRVGHDHSKNEHVWYDLDAVDEVADHVAEQLGKLQPAKAQEFDQHAAEFKRQIGALRDKESQIAAADQGKPVVVTEPIAHYLVEDTRLADVTPPEFVNAVESENDPPATAVAQVNDLINSHRAAAVIFNPQTESPITQGVRSAAEAQHTPVVDMTETLPRGMTYLTWMDSQLTSLQSALNGAAR